MKFGFSMIIRGTEATPETFHALAEKAEQLELDSLWTSSHVVVPQQSVSKYPGREDGSFPPYWLEGYWSPFSVLNYVAGVTSKISLGTSVIILPMHNPIEIARQAADLDILSGGRLQFGLGVGWLQEEFEVLGKPFAERGALMDEGLEIIEALWTQERPSYHGRYYNFDKVYFKPKPVQKPHPPIWLGGHTRVAMRRAARFAAGWQPFRPTFALLEEYVPKMHGFLADAGRKPDSLEIAAKVMLRFLDSPSEGKSPTEGTPQSIVDAIHRFQELGVDHFIFDYTPESREMGLHTMERFAQEVRPKL